MVIPMSNRYVRCSVYLNFFGLCLAEALNHVEFWIPKSTTEATDIISDFYKRQSRDRCERPWMRAEPQQ